jgi:hypothetical protein
MAIKFLSGLNLSNVTAGSILKLDSNGNIVAATAGTDYATSNLWTTTNNGIYYSDDVRIGTYSTSVAPSAKLHVFDYQTTDPKLLIEDGNTGDASMEFKISTQSYTMGIDNSDSDKFVLAASSALGTTNVLEISTSGATAFQTGVLFNDTIYLPGDGTSSREVLLNAHGTRGKLMKEGNATYWQVAQGSNQFYITDAANGNDAIGNVLLRVDGNDANDNELYLVPNNGSVGIGTTDPSSTLHIYKSTGTTSSSTGTTLLTLENYVGSDLNSQKSFIDFVLKDDNGNETPQVRIGAEVGNNDGDASTQAEEGMGAFVVYTNNADTNAGAAGTSLAERFRVDYQGKAFFTNNIDVNGAITGNILYTTGTVRVEGTSSALTLRSDVQHGQGDEDAVIGFNQGTTELAKIDQEGYMYAAGFKVGTGSGVLRADGTTESITFGTMASASTGDYKDSDTVESYVSQELASYTTTSSFGSNAFTSYTDHSTQGYLTSYTETSTLADVTGRGATTTNNISVGNLTAVGGTFTDPVTIYDSTTTENPRLSVGRNAGESIQFDVTDVVNTITAKQDSDSDGDHFFVLDRVFAGAGDSIFRINNDGTPDLTIDGSGVVSFNQYNTAGILKVNTSGTISVDTNTYSTATGVADNADSYGSWTVSDGTNTESITSGTTVAWRGSGATSVSYDSSTNQFSISSTNTQYSAATTSAAGLMSSTDKTKLDGIATGAEVNVQSDWNATTGDAFIKNKPTLGTASASAATDFVSVSGDTMTGALTINQNGDAINLRSTTNAQPSRITFSSDVPAAQIGYIEYSHVNTASYGSGESFVIGGNQTDITILADGKLMYKEGIYSKPASGTGAGTRKDANWDTAYTYSQIGHLPLAGGTMTGDLNLGDNQLVFSNTNVAAPSTTDTGAGTRILLYSPGGEGNHYAIGIESNNMWFNSDVGYKWYRDSSAVMTLDSSSNLDVTGAVTTGGKLYIGSTAATTTATTALFLGAAGEVKKRSLGSNAFTSTTIPTGTASAKAVTDFIQDFGTSTTSDINAIGNASGKYRWNNTTTGRPASSQANEYGTLLNLHYSGNVTTQIAHDIDQANLWIRSLDTESDTGTAWKQIADTAYVTTAISNLVDSAPAALDTLNELAAALGDDASFSTTMSTALGNRLRIDVNNQNLSSTELANARTNLGLGTAATSAAASFVAVSGDTMTGNLTMSSATPTLKFSINGAENNAGIVWEDGDAGDPSAQAAAIKWSASDNHMRFYNNDEAAERMRINSDGTTTFLGTINASAGIGGLTLANGGISGTNYNITGVNQLEISDPGEGIVFKSGSSGDMTLAIVDDSSDNTLKFSGSGARFEVAGLIKHSGLELTSGTSVDQISEFPMTFRLVANTWTDTGIDGTDLSTGTYAMQVYVSDFGVGGQHYDEYYSATISWFAGGTNSTAVDEIPVHRAGHAPNAGDIQFRTQRASGSDSHDLMLQVKTNSGYTENLDNETSGKIMRFKFRRLM